MKMGCQNVKLFLSGPLAKTELRGRYGVLREGVLSAGRFPSPLRADTRTAPSPGAGGTATRVRLVVDGQEGLIATSDIPENIGNSAHLFWIVRIRGVNHVQNQVGFHDLFERRPERGHEFMWQLADEADGIGNEEGRFSTETNTSDQGVQGRKNPTGHERVFA